jgi:hypothetical protein
MSNHSASLRLALHTHNRTLHAVQLRLLGLTVAHASQWRINELGDGFTERRETSDTREAAMILELRARNLAIQPQRWIAASCP